MRIALTAAAAACVLLAACGGPETSQANNARPISATIRGPADRRRRSNGNGHAGCSAAEGPGAADHARAPRRHGDDRQERQGDQPRARRRLARPRASSAPRPRQIADLSQKASGWFPAGTGPDVGKTGAKPEIWQNPQDFAAKLRNFQAAARRSTPPRQPGDVDAIKARFADLGGACKACHDKYRSEMHH